MMDAIEVIEKDYHNYCHVLVTKSINVLRRRSYALKLASSPGSRVNNGNTLSIKDRARSRQYRLYESSEDNKFV